MKLKVKQNQQQRALNGSCRPPHISIEDGVAEESYALQFVLLKGVKVLLAFCQEVPFKFASSSNFNIRQVNAESSRTFGCGSHYIVSI